MLTEADAFRKDGFITVVLFGRLPTPCDEVVVLGYYPANEFGPARVFLREGRKPGMENMFCIQTLGKIWSINRIIPDRYSPIVEIYINDQLVREIRVIEFTELGFHNLH
ncbi:hypothetical protein COJ96_27560 [Bacillus sp. AFS073361]|uniref:hypothetical protein n=1 Tax=Bacillus sp. AFS073361 TaxID=2033511 RepID=UPI000BF844A7|nr:hypothetical protein [Bacillus sp. AFS073361]PFP15985.1 hypothetical protein COJ96_27560 [Bacillus sp. AFS073361]